MRMTMRVSSWTVLGAKFASLETGRVGQIANLPTHLSLA
jgi:hypothetical protein